MQTRAQIPRRSQIIDLPARGCQFHGGHKGEDGFLVACGQPVKPESSYCPEHHRRIYQRAPSLREQRLAAEAQPEPVEVVLPKFEREAA